MWSHGNVLGYGCKDGAGQLDLQALHLEESDARAEALEVGDHRYLGHHGVRLGVCRGGGNPWTIWRLYAGLAGLGVPLLVLVFWFPVVWASLRWLARVAWRCVVPSSSGRRSSVLSLLAPLLGLGAATSILWAVGYASLYYLTPYVQDWRSGTVRHEAVTCRDFDVDNSITHSGNGHARAQYVFKLVSSDGSSWEYRERKSLMDDRVEAGEQPYATVIDACRSEGAEIGIVLYPHSGTIIEAWRNH